jgi:holliday junction DNA helicase RuvA
MMIGYIEGTILFSNGVEIIVNTASGVGYQIYFSGVLAEKGKASLYISHIIKEASEELYGFRTLQEKKLFEMLTSVKGVGPKSAYALLNSLGTGSIIQAIQLESKKTLTKAPGIGPKAAAQIILDLSSKIQKVLMYSRSYSGGEIEVLSQSEKREPEEMPMSLDFSCDDQKLIDEALMACKELGFKEGQVAPMIQKMAKEQNVTRPEQLVHLVLKEI